MVSDYDAVIVGAGHNGLVCGAYLARQGLKVCIVERRAVIGGACATEEIYPGFRASIAAYNLTLLQPKIMLDLALLDHGLEVLKAPPLFEPFPDGGHILLWDDPQKTAAELARFSPEDAAQYPLYLAHLRKLAPLIRRLMWETPPDLQSGALRDRWAALMLLWRSRGLIRHIYDLQELLTMSAYDFLRRWFQNPDVIAVLGFYVSMSGSLLSLTSPGSAFFLIRVMIREGGTQAGGWGIPRGGMGAIADALARSGGRWGMEVRTGDPVSEIVVTRGKATGVALASGKRLASRIVISNADLRTTFQRLLDPALLPKEFAGAVERFRGQGVLFKINLALDARPRFTASAAARLDVDEPVLVRIGPSIGYFERAFEEAGQGAFSREPFMVTQLTTALDPAMAPPGKHVLSLLAGYAPYRLKGRSWAEAKPDLLAATLKTLESYAPGITASILHAQVLTPEDLETVLGLPFGHVHHGDMALDQMFFRRPVAGYARYRSPIAGLYMCGASNHPGGGVTGVPGHNAAREILGDRKRGLWR
jgi:phytoene dehydrogenase-like protein